MRNNIQNKIVLGTSYDPFYNLALEEYLFDNQQDGVTLYLWQNQNTVVIGKHQNAWKECRVALLEEQQGHLARRSTGGGAVYHDLGNLNFTFIAPKAQYNVLRQLGTVQKAMMRLGIASMFTGRNDLVTKDNAKFSGNAFRMGKHVCMHHGTLLVNVDMDKLSLYLMPSKEKLAAKGVDSVRARVCNLKEYAADLTIERVKSAMQEAFVEEYGPAAILQPHQWDVPAFDQLKERYASWEWRFGQTPRFDIAFEKRFDWGQVEFCLQMEKGCIKDARIHSDAMDEAFIDGIAPALIGCPFSSEQMAQRLRALAHPHAGALADFVLEKGF